MRKFKKKDNYEEIFFKKKNNYEEFFFFKNNERLFKQ